MKTVFKDIDHIAHIFVRQLQKEAKTPLDNIQGRGKGRRFYFRGNTCYSYRDDYPLAKVVGEQLWIRGHDYSISTKRQKRAIINQASIKKMEIIFSDDLKKPNLFDDPIKKLLNKAMNALMYGRHYINHIRTLIKENNRNLITFSKFPLLFDKKYNNLKQMLYSNDVETFNLARKIIKEQKLI